MHDRSERTLRRGRVVFEVARDLRITLVSGGASDEISLPCPRAGYGGHELVVGRNEDYLALFLYSGQSEQGWELFTLAPQLRHVGGLPYVDGEGDAPQFSPDGQWLAMLVAIAPRVRGSGAYFEDASDPDATGSVVVDWARLYVQRLPDREIACHSVGALVPAALDPDEVESWTTYGAMRFAAANTIELTSPWHERITCPLPITDVPVATYSAP